MVVVINRDCWIFILAVITLHLLMVLWVVTLIDILHGGSILIFGTKHCILCLMMLIRMRLIIFWLNFNFFDKQWLHLTLLVTFAQLPIQSSLWLISINCIAWSLRLCVGTKLTSADHWWFLFIFVYQKARIIEKITWSAGVTQSGGARSASPSSSSSLKSFSWLKWTIFHFAGVFGLFIL